MTTITIKIKNPCRKVDDEYFRSKNIENFEVEINGKEIPLVKRFVIDLDQQKLNDNMFTYNLEQYLDIAEEYYPGTCERKSSEELSKYWEE